MRPGRAARARRGAHAVDSPDVIEAQIERLEIHPLARPEGDLHFAPLSDWTDAATGDE
jgi:hypothetical protein